MHCSIRLGRPLGLNDMKMKPIKWDGRERTAERILRIMPAGTISTWGGAPGFPREIFICGKHKRDVYSVPKGKRIGINRRGNPCVIN